MSWKKKTILILLGAFLAIQFIQPARNQNKQVLAVDITNTVVIPDKVLGILKKACYDCHSNNTRYPWYVNIQPLGWSMAKHIKNGKANLNFSEFGAYTKRRQVNKIRAIETSVKESSMPLSSYTLIHTDARLNKEDKGLIIDWARNVIDSLKAKK